MERACKRWRAEPHVEQGGAGVIKQGWMTHELQTTNNFARDYHADRNSIAQAWRAGSIGTIRPPGLPLQLDYL